MVWVHRSFRDHPVQPPYHWQRHLPLEQAAESPIQHFEVWGIHSFSVPVSTILPLKNIASCPVTAGPGKVSLHLSYDLPLYIKRLQSAFLQRLLFSRLNKPNALILSSQKWSIPLITAVVSSGPTKTDPRLFVLGVPHLDAVLHAWSDESWAEGQNHLPQPAGHASLDAAQNMTGFLGCKRTLSGHT